jgi:homoserine kinase type II
MAVYTQVSDEELARFVSSYGLGELKSYKGIAEGVENTNYLVNTSSGPFILTLYEKRVAQKDLPFFLELMDHLASSGIKCPTPLHDREGRMLRQLAGRPAAIITFLEGLWVRRPRVEHCALLGRSLAEFHVVGQNYRAKRANTLSVSGWRPLFKACGGDIDTIAPGLAQEIETELAHLEANWPTALPGGIIHADLFPDNVFFLGSKVSGLIDFYFACNDMLALDIAICLNAWCFEPDGAFNVTKARALLNAYTSERALSADELEFLPLLARGAAMRFLLTRVYDWLHTSEHALVERKDPIEYLRKLRFHARVTSVNEYGLENA